MILPVVVVRPEPGLSATVAEAGALGLHPVAAPLFAIEPRAWDSPGSAAIDGLLIGSANAIRHGGPPLQPLTGKPVYAVGEATAQAAREAGLTVLAVGAGGLQRVLDGLTGPLRLLRLAGEEHVPLAPPTGIEIVTRVVYASVPRPLSDDMAARLGAGAVVLLHSAAAARHFAAECDRLGVFRQSLRLAALAPRVAEAAGSGWAELAVAPEATDAALLALAGRMCHASPPEQTNRG